MSNRFTPAAEKALNQSLYLARSLGHTYIGTEHILLGLISEKDCVAARILSLRGITQEKIRSALLTLVGSGIPTRISPDDLTPRARAVIERAAYCAMKAGQGRIGTEHLLLGITEETECCAARLLIAQQVTPGELRSDTERYLNDLSGKAERDGKGGTREEGKNLPTLRLYTRDLCAMAARGELDPLIGREQELSHMIRVLCRRGKNNPCLIGEPGVGKTAMAEGLASRIAEGRVPPLLRGKRILSLDLSAMIAGAKYRGEFEERMKAVMNEVRTHREILLFIDEIHTIAGAGSAEGAVDAANILKPALARGEIQIIGATTCDEYRRHIEKDGALERRFQPILLAESTPEQTGQILRGLRPALESHHGVVIPDAAIDRAVMLSVRYLHDRFLPDKAIDLLDEGCASLCLSEGGDAADIASYDAPAPFADHTLSFPPSPRTLSEDVLDRLITEQTGIPIRQSEEERQRLVHLEEFLSERVIGQEDAIRTVAHTIRASRAGIASDARPSASFFFLGPSGVGKTELARAIAQQLFGTDTALIRFDMSEYMEKHSISRLIGSPPGYVGHEDGGQFLRIRQHPYSVLLLDEIEKAHPDVANLFLQILEEGEATDAQGRKINFRNCILIFTSNLDARGTAHPGFRPPSADTSAREDVQARLRSALKQHFSPELLGRMDEIVPFRRLDRSDLATIAENEMSRLAARSAARGITLSFPSDFSETIAAEAFGSDAGARAVRRLIRERAEYPLAKVIFSEQIENGAALQLTERGWRKLCMPVPKK